MTDSPQASWHGIPRKEIPWFPTMDVDACINCGLCLVTCGRGVYATQGRKVEAVEPYACMVGCSTCATVCPTEAIRLPDTEVVRRIEREHKIFRIIQEEARTKRGKRDALKARAAAEESVAKLSTRSRIEIAGNFGEKHFLVQLEERIANHSVDITNLQVQVPTLKGFQEGTPAFMSFEVTSTIQEDIQSFLPAIRDLIRLNGFILVNETHG